MEHVGAVAVGVEDRAWVRETVGTEGELNLVIGCRGRKK